MPQIVKIKAVTAVENPRGWNTVNQDIVEVRKVYQGTNNVPLSLLGNQLIKCEARLSLPGERSKLGQSTLTLIADT